MHCTRVSISPKKHISDGLITSVGNRDPYVENEDQYGPVLSFLQVREFSRIYLFCTGSDYLERARMVDEDRQIFLGG